MPRLPIKTVEKDPYPLVGNDAVKTSLPAKSDLSDWVDLMDVVGMLCPVWPKRGPAAERGSDYRL